MTKTKVPRKIKKNLFFSKLRLHGLTLEKLGKRLSPPVGKVRLSEIIYTATPEYRLKEIAAHLQTNVQTLFPKEKKQTCPHGDPGGLCPGINCGP